MFRMSSPETFPYAPLDLSRRTFRLVRLLPPKPSVIPGCYGTLRIELLEAEIDDAAKPSCEYDALTYVWGVTAQDKPTRAIIVEDRGKSYRLWIHRPLELALLHFIENKVSDLPLFVDQICINQGEDNNGEYNEKAHQVSLMRDIYSQCNRAIVWLGTATRGSDEWFKYTREICHEGLLSGLMGPRVSTFMQVFDAVMDPSIEVTGQQREDRDALLELVRRRGDQYPIAGYTDVLDRSWFNRLWTIQEACLAPGVIMVCGSQSLCFDCFRAGALFYNIYNTHWVGQLREAKSKSELRQRDAVFQKTSGFHRVFQERKAIHMTGTRQSFYNVILKYNVNEDRAKIGATLPEDRIFGLLGLTADDDPLRQQVRVRYNPVDPEAEVVRIYTEVAALLLGDNIDALLYVQAGKKTRGLPSWVPDWKMELKLPVGYTSLKEPLFNAGGPRDQGRFHVHHETGRLTIRGCIVGEVVAVGELTYRDRVDSMIQRDVDYRWAKKFFDEAAQFTRDAGAMRNDDTASLALQSQRVCDSGLSYQQFVNRLGLDDGIKRLGVVHGYYYRIGQRLLESDATVASYHISRIYRTVGITPWYFIPPPEMDTLRICARDPASACRVLCSALSDFVEDMVGLCVASAHVSILPYYLQLRRRYGKVTLYVGDETMRKYGLDPDQGVRKDMTAFSENILKNVGRRLYRTATGHVGIGPPEMRPRDAVTVFHGGTTPHLLRRVARPESGDDDELWQYVGEAYCDGIMHGEALGAISERRFTLC
ncbi:heterokaryon incompatibility protein [Metarhizium acridum CQMa 102]|uniref:Heterokaryon incompatibility protein n=1 Tax=Metarhizium acridum (strain CQMa 102) TaxID=655827 RepID=E9E7K3_METAQ|nr:heterokaryon incompatibility protein [Metarhizium acridum CQMa 102]EFY88113.1 heterokaryon incompatibility protein [Metarhizium acridum CQMa 102]